MAKWKIVMRSGHGADREIEAEEMVDHKPWVDFYGAAEPESLGGYGPMLLRLRADDIESVERS